MIKSLCENFTRQKKILKNITEWQKLKTMPL